MREARGIGGFIAVVVTVLGLAAPSAGAATTNPCRLVTATDAREVAGIGFAAGRHEQLGLYDSCAYIRGSRTVTAQTRRMTRSEFRLSVGAGSRAARRLRGLGAEAWLVSDTVVAVWKDGRQATFLVLGVPDPVASATKLARSAARRL